MITMFANNILEIILSLKIWKEAPPHLDQFSLNLKTYLCNFVHWLYGMLHVKQCRLSTYIIYQSLKCLVFITFHNSYPSKINDQILFNHDMQLMKITLLSHMHRVTIYFAFFLRNTFYFLTLQLCTFMFRDTIRSIFFIWSSYGLM